MTINNFFGNQTKYAYVFGGHFLSKIDFKRTLATGKKYDFFLVCFFENYVGYCSDKLSM